MPKLFDLVDGRIEQHTTIGTERPLVIPSADVIAGRTDHLLPTSLPMLGGVIAVDFETCARPEWKCITSPGLDPHLSIIRTIQVSDGSRCWIVDTLHTPDWKDWLRELLNSADEVIAHNARFEAKNVHVHLGRQPNIAWRCTYIASILVEYAHKHSLEAVTQRWTGYAMDKTEQMSDWGTPVLSRSQVLYGLRDVVYMHALHSALCTELKRRGMLELFTELECPLIAPLAEIETTGLPVNTHYVRETRNKVEAEVQERGDQVRRAIFQTYKRFGNPDRLRNILWKSGSVTAGARVLLPDQMETESQIVLSNNQALMQYFFAITGPHGPMLEDDSIDKSTLFNCVSRAEFEIDGETVNLVWALLKYKERAKRLEFLVKLDTPWSPNLPKGQACRHPVTDRIHTEIKYAVTGRLLATSGSGREDAEEDLMGDSKVNKDTPWLMNVQQFPRGSEVRSCFGFEGYTSSGDSAADPIMDENGNVTGWEEHGEWTGGTNTRYPGEWGVISADYSALEAFVLAHLSQDPQLLDAVTSADFHRTNASRIYGVPVDEVEKWMRQVAKNVGYCTAYGGGAPKIAQTANMAFIEQGTDTRISQADAQEAQAKYFAAYPMVEPYLEREFKQVMKFGWTRPTKLGRTRNISAEVEYERKVKGNTHANPRTKAYNNPMQASNADIIKKALLELYRVIVVTFRTDQVELGMPIHDELLNFAVRECLPQLGVIKARVMKDAMDLVLSDRDDVPTFNVPVSPSYGPSWGHAH